MRRDGRAADAAGRAGDEGDAALEVNLHCRLPARTRAISEIPRIADRPAAIDGHDVAGGVGVAGIGEEQRRGGDLGERRRRASAANARRAGRRRRPTAPTASALTRTSGASSIASAAGQRGERRVVGGEADGAPDRHDAGRPR